MCNKKSSGVFIELTKFHYGKYNKHWNNHHFLVIIFIRWDIIMSKYIPDVTQQAFYSLPSL